MNLFEIQYIPIASRLLQQYSSKEYQTSAKMNVKINEYFVCVIICYEQNKMALDKTKYIH